MIEAEIPVHLRRPFLRPPQAAEVISALTGVPINKNSLAILRTRGTGPLFRRVGGRSIVYGLDDLVSWSKDRVSGPLSSTAQLEAAE